MIKRKIRVLFSPTLTIVLSIFSFSCIGVYIFTMAYDASREVFLTYTSSFILWTVMCGGLPLVALITVARKLYTVITIDETGVSRAFLGKFYKLHIPWNEMAEAYYFVMIAEFVSFSKHKKLSELSYNKMRAEKSAIEMTISKKRYAVIMQYIQQPIVGMPENVKKRLESYRKTQMQND